MRTDSPRTHQGISLRKQRAQAARLLSSSVLRLGLDWNDLLKLPTWATLPSTDLEHVAWCVGVWFYADELQHSIDGQLLSHLHSRLGDAAFNALIAAPASADGRSASQRLLNQMSTLDLDEMFCVAGREGLLSSIDSESLRRSLGEVLWPSEPEVTASARRLWLGRQVVNQALSYALGTLPAKQGTLA